MNVLEMIRSRIGFNGIFLSLAYSPFKVYRAPIERTVGAALRGRPRFEHDPENLRSRRREYDFKSTAATEGRPYNSLMIIR